jgi:N-acetylglutamate synthase-like GNAT family acetyltransferase
LTPSEARLHSLSSGVAIRPLRSDEVDLADRVMRVAFGTFFGAPDPIAAMGDMECVRPRFAAEPEWAFAAELDGEVVGSNLATRWGSFAFFGPLTVRPDLWDRGIASALMRPIVDLFDAWQVRQAALFTFSQSTKHVGLYQKFGFWPQYLTAVMGRQLEPSAPDRAPGTYSQAADGERAAIVSACREVTDAIFEGLDVAHEIRAAHAQELGDTVLLHEASELVGFAVCHCGAGEAGSGACYVKFAAVRPGPDAGARFERMLQACEAHARACGLQRVMAGVNLARHEAYRTLLARGYTPRMQGVIMQRPNQPGYCRPDVYAIDDLR